MEEKKYAPKKGEVVAWDLESANNVYNKVTKKYENKGTYKTTAIAVAMNEDEFSVCLNFRGHKDEEERIWEWDNFPGDVKLRRADRFETAILFAELIAQGFEFRAENGEVSVNISWLDDVEKVEKAIEEHPDIPLPLSREARFQKYIKELVDLYLRQKSLMGMTQVRSSNNISGICKDAFYWAGLDKLTDSSWIYSKQGTAFAKALYQYALGHTKTMPTVTQYKTI